MGGRLVADSELLGTLRALREATASIAERQAEYGKRRAALDAEEEAATAPLVALRDQLLGDVAAWFRARKDQLDQTRSLQTIHGRLGLRATGPKVRYLKGEAYTTQVLRARGLTEAFVTREELSVDALRRLPVSELRQAGVTFERAESAYLRLPDGTAFSLDPDEEAPHADD